MSNYTHPGYMLALTLKHSGIVIHSLCVISAVANHLDKTSLRFETGRKIFELASSFMYFFFMSYCVFSTVVDKENQANFRLVYNILIMEELVFFSYIMASACFMLIIYLTKFDAVWRTSRHKS